MIRLGIAISSPNGIVIDSTLAELSTKADRETLVAIARFLLTRSPPLWLALAVNERSVLREYIPQGDLQDLIWIDPELDLFLIGINSSIQRFVDDEYAKRLGEAAEFFVFSALKYAGLAPVHVATISDAYGYDIECRGTKFDRIEVKACSRNTQGNFYISRNEFDKSVLYGKQWRLLQLTFSNQAFVDETLDFSHIESIHELKFGVLNEIIPRDTPSFRWVDSALVSAVPDQWRAANIRLDPTFVTNGFRTKTI